MGYNLCSITVVPLSLGYYPESISFERVTGDRHRRGVAGGREVSKAERARILVGYELSILKMLSGENAFEISDIQEDESEASLEQNVTMLHCVESD
jgi:hypothetical protein